MISIIIPVLNEEKTIEALLKHLAALPGAKELIVADGGSTDHTKVWAQLWARVVDCPPGRGPQCNAAAAQARGDILLFLHADSQLAHQALVKLERAVATGACWGCFRLRFDDPHWLSRLIAVCANLRVRWRRIVFGDQGIFMRREFFEQIGGFPALALMEDYQLSLDLRTRKIKPVQVRCRITSSARRFVAGGRLRTLWRMRRLRQRYRAGCDAAELQAQYREVR